MDIDNYTSTIWSAASPQEAAYHTLSVYGAGAKEEVLKRRDEAVKEQDSSRAFFWQWVANLIDTNLEGAIEKEYAVAEKIALSLLDVKNAPTVLANSINALAERRMGMTVIERASLIATVKLIERDILGSEIEVLEVKAHDELCRELKENMQSDLP